MKTYVVIPPLETSNLQALTFDIVNCQIRKFHYSFLSFYSFQLQLVDELTVFISPIMTAADDIHKYFFIVLQRK